MQSNTGETTSTRGFSNLPIFRRKDSFTSTESANASRALNRFYDKNVTVAFDKLR